MSRATGLRLLKFSAVGAIGVGVQLGALAVLHAMEITYLPATALAVECAVIHNFLWHRRFTWADRSRWEHAAFLCRYFVFIYVTD